MQEKKQKIDFQDCGHGGHLGFPIGMILAILYLQVTPMLPSKFRVNWPFGSGEEAKNRFSRWRPSWISDRHDFSYVLTYHEGLNNLGRGSPKQHSCQVTLNLVQCFLTRGFLKFFIYERYIGKITFLPSYNEIGPVVSDKKIFQVFYEDI